MEAKLFTSEFCRALCRHVVKQNATCANLFQCSTCQKGFRGVSSLIEHKKCHEVWKYLPEKLQKMRETSARKAEVRRRQNRNSKRRSFRKSVKRTQRKLRSESVRRNPTRRKASVNEREKSKDKSHRSVARQVAKSRTALKSRASRGPKETFAGAKSIKKARVSTLKKPTRTREKGTLPRKNVKSSETRQCEHCHNLFADVKKYLSHIRKHKAKLPFACSKCPERFRWKLSLEHHSQMHSRRTVQPSSARKCPTCSKKFDRFVDFYRHTKSHMDKDRPRKRTDKVANLKSEEVKIKHVCKLCHRKVKAPETHQCTRNRAYVCYTCNRQFKTKLKLKVHECSDVDSTEEMVFVQRKRVNKSKKHQCKLCQELFDTNQELKRHECVSQVAISNEVNDDKVTATYDCEVCSKQLKNAKTLRRHRLIHSRPPRVYDCEHCEIKFTRKSYLIVHRSTHKENTKCDVCSKESKEFKSRSEFNRHVLSHTGFECEHCQKRFHRQSYLKLHMTIHSDKKPYQCETCQSAFLTKQSLRRHEQTHDEGKIESYTCKICEQKFRTTYFMKLHRMKVHEGITGHPCVDCDKTFDSYRSLVDHRVTHIGDRETFGCDECSVKFFSKQSLRRHLISHGKGPPLYPCDVCEKEFKTSGERARHYRTHTQDRRFHCDKCPRSFLRADAFRLHQYTHSETRNFVCNVCDMAYFSERGLLNHKNMKHGEANVVKKYFCKYCDSQFSYPTDLKRHIYSHTGERPYCCDQCNKTFVRSTSLREHKRVHSGEKPYACKVCNKAFTASRFLIQHRRVHTKIRPLLCTICKRGFAVRRDLENHQRTHNRVKLFSCQFCHKGLSSKYIKRSHEAKCPANDSKSSNDTPKPQKPKRQRKPKSNKPDLTSKGSDLESGSKPSDLDVKQNDSQTTDFPKPSVIMNNETNNDKNNGEKRFDERITVGTERNDNLDSIRSDLSNDVIPAIATSSVAPVNKESNTVSGVEIEIDAALNVKLGAISERDMKAAVDKIMSNDAAMDNQSLYRSSIDLIKHLNSSEDANSDNLQSLISQPVHEDGSSEASDLASIADSCDDEEDGSSVIIQPRAEAHTEAEDGDPPTLQTILKDISEFNSQPGSPLQFIANDLNIRQDVRWQSLG